MALELPRSQSMPATMSPVYQGMPHIVSLEDVKSGSKRKQQPTTTCNNFANVSSRSCKRPRKADNKKRVGFAWDRTASHKKDAVHSTVVPRCVYQEDLPNAWYTRQDYRSFREDSRSLAMAFELGILDRVHPDELCLRGLEANLSKGHLEARLASRRTLTNFILRTQEAQKGHGIRDPELIRGLSMVLSKDACEDALKLAAFDREEVDSANEEPER